jgi:hypothetical protein
MNIHFERQLNFDVRNRPREWQFDWIVEFIEPQPSYDGKYPF